VILPFLADCRFSSSAAAVTLEFSMTRLIVALLLRILSLFFALPSYNALYFIAASSDILPEHGAISSPLTLTT
jgi:hypothetical protein